MLDTNWIQQTVDIAEYRKKEYLLETMKKRFLTYGYQQVQTSTFEQYDLYQTISGTINPEEMIKVIDPSGKVLVLRPDVTIPITNMIASASQTDSLSKRLFYTTNVYRNSEQTREETQAGIENFSPKSAALDAEVMTLAIQILKDIGYRHFKLGIGHAGFFKELLRETSLTDKQINRLQSLIRAKNVSALDVFLGKLPIHPKTKLALKQIPLLYGKPEKVLYAASSLALNSQMKQKLDNMEAIYEVLKLYHMEDFISFDLGLINHMNYYSDIIFQGFIDNFGKPVLMGGRYDQLTNQLHTQIPAIGFACNVDNMLTVMEQQSLLPDMSRHADIAIYYIPAKQKEALAASQSLRHSGRKVITDIKENIPAYKEASRIIHYDENLNQLDGKPFSDLTELIQLLKGED